MAEQRPPGSTGGGRSGPSGPLATGIALLVVVLIGVGFAVILGTGHHGRVAGSRKPSAGPSKSPPSQLEPTGGTDKPLPRPSTPPPKPLKGNGAASGVLRTVLLRYPLRVTQANIYHGLSWPKAESDLTRLVVPGTDIVGVNEASPQRARQISAWVGSHPGWHYYAPDPTRSPYQTDDSFLWNDRNLRFVNAGSEYASRSATPTYKINSRWISWGEFVHRATNTKVFYLETHDDPAVERGGHPRAVAAVGTNMDYMHHVLAMSERFAQQGVVIIGGDWNVNARADMAVKAPTMPYSVLEGDGAGPIISNYVALGFTFPPTSPESHRWIDYIAIWDRFAAGAPRLSFERQFSATHVFSDHDPITVDFQLSVVSLIGLDQLRKLLKKVGAGG